MTAPSALKRKLSVHLAMSEDELATIERLERRRRRFSSGQELIHEGQLNRSGFIIAEGWALSFKILPNGDRQIIDVHIPGDFLGVRSVFFKESDHTVEALTDIEVSELQTAEISEGFSLFPRLATAVRWASARDEAMLAEHLVDLGRRSAEERMAHFLLELGERLKLVGLGDETGFDCPLTQYHLADILGLTPVHVNRVLRRLREIGFLRLRRGRVDFDDITGLQEMAAFDASYLDQEVRLFNRSVPVAGGT